MIGLSACLTRDFSHQIIGTWHSTGVETRTFGLECQQLVIIYLYLVITQDNPQSGTLHNSYVLKVGIILFAVCFERFCKNKNDSSIPTFCS